MKHVSMIRALGMMSVLAGLVLSSGPAEAGQGGEKGGSRFVVLKSGDVLDRSTSLQWQHTPGTPGPVVSNCDIGNECNWTEATAYCAARGEGSRLPEVKELISLIDYSEFDPALPQGHPFGIVQSATYWSATTNADSPTDAWNVLFGNGDVDDGNKFGGTLLAWCVRLTRALDHSVI